MPDSNDTSVSISVKGFDELYAALKQLPAAAQGTILLDLVMVGCEVVRQAAVAKIHSRTGTLVRKLVVRRLESDRAHAKAAVRDGARYAHLVEMGHAIVRGGKKSKGGKVIGQVPPYPFLRPAMDESGETALEKMRLRLAADIDSAWDQVRAGAGSFSFSGEV